MPEQQFPVKLSQAQRRALAELFPAFRGRLKLDECNQRMISFTLRELQKIAWKSKTAVRNFDNGMTRNSLHHVSDIAIQTIDDFQGIGSIPVSLRIYQFKITLKEIQPSIWRRFQVWDGTLDKFHGHIQLAMGWTNSHLHHFQIGDQEVRRPGPTLLLVPGVADLAMRGLRLSQLFCVVSSGGFSNRQLELDSSSHMPAGSQWIN